ncbi:MAG: amino acid ABC transporter permease [Propionibacteriales bacterium]|nr:amino acid ABC transporter permease [Propionibacteriales bacterium]
MNVLIDNFPEILDGFIKTLWLLLFAGLIAMVLGTLLAAMRVSPIGVVRGAGTTYINMVRNTPLLLILFLFRDAFPQLGFAVDFTDYFNFFFVAATLGLGLYTAAFVCEALRSGVNSIPVGQAEAARSIGMTFSQSMTTVILPQAFRAVVPPLANTYIALAKNTSVALAIGVTEAGYVMGKLTNDNAADRWWIFFGFAAGYIAIVWAIAGTAKVFERRGAVSR